jgi:hypothetical protein
MTYKDDEIEKEISEQQKLIKKPIDIAARKRHLSLLRSYEVLLNSCANEREFSDRIIAELQIIYGSPQYAAALEVYRSFRGSK